MPAPEPNDRPARRSGPGACEEELETLRADVLRYEAVMASSRYRVHQREQGILVLAELQRAMGEDLALAALLERVVGAVNQRMGMDRTVVLVSADTPGRYTPVEWAGFPAAADQRLDELELDLPSAMPGDAEGLLVNAATGGSALAERVLDALGLPYFVCTRIGTGPSAVGLLLTGRLVEEAGSRPPLDHGDLVTAQAVAGLVFAFEQAREVAELKVDRERRRLEVRKARELSDAHRRLQETQAALVEQNRLASLGRLTAGVAHEIKNPLNFITNFAGLAVELVDELAAVLSASSAAGGGQTQEVRDLLADLRLNTERIAQHGHRADTVVRSMLMHSRADDGDRRAVDLNALVDEHVELAYHAAFAEAPGFHVRIVRSYADDLAPVAVVPQEMGRVMLNLLGNAFHAVRERIGTDGPNYEPLVTVATAGDDDHVEIRVTDNGAGIPEEIRAKVFEPFFTTKPPGMGTGLGLSLSSELVTRGHGGTLEVESDGQSGTTFVVTLPRNAPVGP